MVKISTKLLVALTVFIFLFVSLSYASPNQPNSNTVGYEFLDSNEVLHIWNENDDYYFNYSSGIQLTNHYNNYWSHNVFCGGAKISGSWNYYCTDSLPFSWNVSSDNNTFVWYRGYKDVTIGQYSARFALDYYLRSGDTQIAVTPSMNNTGVSIPIDLSFRWKIKDIQVNMSQQNNVIYINGTNYNLNESTDKTYNSVDRNFFKIVNNGESLRLEWDAFANYSLSVKSEAGQYNAPVALNIFFSGLSSGSSWSSTFYWIDAIDCYVMWGDKYSPSGNYPSNTKFSDGNHSWGMTCHIDPTSTACQQPAGDPGSCNRNVCTISRRLLNHTTQNESAWAPMASTSGTENCGTNDVSPGTYADFPSSSMESNNDLRHNVKTDYRCQLDIRTFDGECLVQVQTNITKDDYWYNNNTPRAQNVTITPSSPTNDDNLFCNYTFFDADSDSQNTSLTIFNWSRNGIDININNQTLSSGNLTYGNYSCSVKAFDNVFATGKEVANSSVSVILIANEYWGRLAIEEGINRSVPSSSRYSDQQVYVVYASGTQKKGKFDSVAYLNGQAWSCNYVTGNENFTSIDSVFKTVNKWENQTLTYLQIASQVESLINSTKEEV